MDTTWLWLAAAGFFAGIINTLAGGGSLITLPALLWAGLPVHVANGTNRISVLLASVTATASYRRRPVPGAALTWSEVVPACAGALVGSWGSLDVDEARMRQVIGLVMLIMLGVVLAKPKAWLEGRGTAVAWPWRALGFFAVGLYGGFLQAGVGIFLLAAFVGLSGKNLVAANVGKVVIVLLFTLPAIAVFAWHDAVRWGPGLAMAAGSSLGGWVGARWTVAWGPAVVRWILIAVVVVSSTKLLGLW